MMNNCSFLWIVCNHNDIMSMSCHEYFLLCFFGVATKMLKTCSFVCFVCTHDEYIVGILHCVFLPMSPLTAPRIFTNSHFQFFVCNLSNLLGDFVFSHFGDVPTNCLHIDLAYELYCLYLCCANGAMNKIGHVSHDMIHFQAHTKFAWSLAYRYYNWKGWHEWLLPQNAMKDNLAHRAHQKLAKVTSFYISDHAMNFKDWLLFECCFVFIVSLVDYMMTKETLKS